MTVVATATLTACQRMPLPQRCRMEDETVVAEGWGSIIRTVALAKRRGRLLAVWSDASGTKAQLLTREGVAVGRAQLVAPAAEAVDVAPLRDGFALAVLRPGDLVWGGGGAFLVHLDPRGRPTAPEQRLGPAGAFSKRISIAAWAGRPLVTWEDGTPGDPSVRLWREERGAERISADTANGCCPHVTADSSRALIVYGQYTVPGPEGRVLLRRLDGSGELSDATEVATSTVAETLPAVADGGDEVHLVYRSEPEGWRPSLLYARLDESGRTLAGPSRIGRYDGTRRAVLMRVGSVLTAAEVRSWAREWIVALDRFTPDGERLGAQFHIFFDWVRFTDVDAVRLGTRYLLLYGEDHPRQRVWLGEVRCR